MMDPLTNRPAPRTLVITDHYLPEFGGNVTWFENVYRRFPRDSVRLLTLQNVRSAGEARSELNVTRAPWRGHGPFRAQRLVGTLLLRALMLAVRHRIQVTHAGKCVPEGLVARGLQVLYGVPYIVYAHGEDLTVLLRRRRFARLIRMILCGAQRVIANSRFTVDVVRQLGVPEANIVLLSPGIDCDRFAPRPRDSGLASRHDLKGRIILSVGRLQERKGQDRVIAALPEILEAFPDAVYVVAGEGIGGPALMHLARDLGVIDAVRFLGRVTDEELPLLYNAADLFVMANRETDDGDLEGFGIVLLEAAASGLPVIAGLSGGTGDAMQDGTTGVRIDGTSPQEIARAVIALLGDPTRCRAMGEAGRRMAISRADWQQLTDRTIALTNEALG